MEATKTTQMGKETQKLNAQEFVNNLKKYFKFQKANDLLYKLYYELDDVSDITSINAKDCENFDKKLNSINEFITSFKKEVESDFENLKSILDKQIIDILCKLNEHLIEKGFEVIIDSFSKNISDYGNEIDVNFYIKPIKNFEFLRSSCLSSDQIKILKNKASEIELIINDILKNILDSTDLIIVRVNYLTLNMEPKYYKDATNRNILVSFKIN